MDLVIAEDTKAVRILRLNRPEVRNALSAELQDELLARAKEATAETGIRAIVLTGSGKSFCSGLDLADLKAISTRSAEENRADAARLATLLEYLYTCPKPVVAAVNGHAVGGGAGLASVCDLVVMSGEAKLGYTEVKIGFVPALVSVFLLRQVGERQARRLLLTGQLVTAEEVLRMGLINEIAAPEEVLPRALALAQEMAENSATSLMLTKSLLAVLPGMGFAEALRYAIDLNTLARASDDLKEGIAAFLEKRSPSWTR